MEPRYGYIAKAYDRVRRKLMAPDVPPAVKRWALGHLQDTRAERDLVLRKDDGYHDFLLAYISQEADKPRPGEDLAESPYDEPRTEPLCTCTYSGCHLKHGQLGPRIRNAPTITEGIRAFQREHNGLPIVLVGKPGSDDAQGARDAWSELCGTVEYRIGVLHAELTKPNLEAPPDPDPLDEPRASDVVTPEMVAPEAD